MNYRRKMTPVTGTLNTSGDGTVVPAPTGGTAQRICITAMTLQNESATPTTVIGKDGTVPVWRFLGQTQGAALQPTFSADAPLVISPGNAFILNLSGSNAIGYSINYYLESTAIGL